MDRRAGPAVSSGPGSPSLRVVLDELRRSGSGSLDFWRVYWAALPRLTDADLLRVAQAVGPRGHTSPRAPTADGRAVTTSRGFGP